MSTDDRRDLLLIWLHEHGWPEDVVGITAQEVVRGSRIYDGHYRYDRCFDDLKALQREGYVERQAGRPARFTVVAA